MGRLDVSGGFDVHDYRDGLQVLEPKRDRNVPRESRGLRLPRLRPAFERLTVAELSELTVSSAPDGPICIARAPDGCSS